MSNDLHLELQQARDAFAKFGTLATIDGGLAGKYLDAAIAAREGNDRGEWDSLFGFWRTMIRGRLWKISVRSMCRTITR